jgi:hypothetical protein
VTGGREREYYELYFSGHSLSLYIFKGFMTCLITTDTRHIFKKTKILSRKLNLKYISWIKYTYLFIKIKA